MCGIAGYLGHYNATVARRMASRIRHRGPDDEGFFFDQEAGIGLAHRRLAILDLSPSGHQPMASRSGRFTICYNGEIYNFLDLKRDLEAGGVRFRSQCDTEVIVELFAREGPRCFAKLNGIFALAVWDAQERVLVLARDGLGVKPLYLTRTASGVAFASEMKALLEVPDLDRTLDPVGAAAYLSYLWSPGSRTMLRSVDKLEPGSWVSFSRAGKGQGGRFYTLPPPAPMAFASDEELIAGTERALRTAVHRQMLSDVEVGAFLSGGLDSSAIVAFARERSRSDDLQCFTIAYDATDGADDAMIADLPYARRAAAHLGVQLHEIRVDASLAHRFEHLVYHLDEPQADPAALNSLAIAALSRKHGIKVLLSGTGGDDVFTGYRRHNAAALDQVWQRTPAAVRRLIDGAAQHLPATGHLRRVRKLLDGVSAPTDRRLAQLFEWLSPDASAALLLPPKSAIAPSPREPLTKLLAGSRGQHPVERVLRLDQRFFLTDHNLNYTDKTGMAEGVEIRVPFLDPDLMTWAAGVPTRAKLRRGQTKWVLRKAMEPYLPKDIIYRPKTGFGVPLRSWLRSEMRPMMDDLLSRKTIESRGLFDLRAVKCLKQDTLAGWRDGSYTLLGLMAIELWCRHFVDAPSRTSAPSGA